MLEETRERKLQGKVTSNYLFFVEHLPVYTLGKSGKEGNMLIDTIQLQGQACRVYKSRPGRRYYIFHGPGQLVAYPVIDLENFMAGE